jgi:hypothetical protein
MHYILFYTHFVNTIQDVFCENSFFFVTIKNNENISCIDREQKREKNAFFFLRSVLPSTWFFPYLPFAHEKNSIT